MILALVIPACCLNNRFLYPVHEKINLAIIAQFMGIVSHDSAQHIYPVNTIKHPGFWKAPLSQEITAFMIKWNARFARLWQAAHRTEYNLDQQHGLTKGSNGVDPYTQQTKNPAKKQGFYFETIKRIISRAPSSWSLWTDRPGSCRYTSPQTRALQNHWSHPSVPSDSPPPGSCSPMTWPSGP